MVYSMREFRSHYFKIVVAARALPVQTRGHNKEY
jgi:hypothetical protein